MVVVVVTQLCLTLCTPWSIALQAPLSMGFSRQEYWSGLPFPPLEDLPDSGIEPRSPAWAGGSFTTETLGKPHSYLRVTVPNKDNLGDGGGGRLKQPKCIFS